MQNLECTRALLISIRTPKVTDIEAKESLVELERLIATLGFEVVGTVSQRLPNTNGVTVVGEGKLAELVSYAKTEAIDLIVFDCDLRPSQVRNVEAALGVPVLDRTGVIIEIFSRHAKTRAAQLQVEIARQKYQAPRLRAMGVGKERHSGRGSGESGLEIEKRKIRDRLSALKLELQAVQEEEKNRRSQRSEQLCVALVGYTNAGKSSLMRALTGSEVLVEDKLFATLDTTVRALQPETQPRILVTDTVGFIDKLPHDLVASFKSTLDEARNASLLLYVVDASDAGFRSQLEVVREVLGEIGAEKTPYFLLFNKSDCLTEEQKQNLQQEFPNATLMSALSLENIQELRARMIAFFEQDMIEEEILVPYHALSVIGVMRLNINILKEDFLETGIRLLVRARPMELRRFKKMLAQTYQTSNENLSL